MDDSVDSPVRIVVVGFSGLIGKRHTAHVAKSTTAELAAVIDPSPGAALVLESLGLVDTPLLPSVDALLSPSSNVAKPDGAIVCTPNHTHVHVASQLVSAGIHVLVEKPISDNESSGQELIELARLHGVHLLVGHHRRFNPYVIAAKKAIDDGVIGDVIAVSALWSAFKPDPYFDADPALVWRKSRSRGGGVTLINFVHEADCMQHLLGPITQIQSVETIRQREQRRRAAGNTVEADDAPEEGFALTLKFASGVVGTYVVSDAVVSPHNFEMGTAENPEIPAVRLDGSQDEIDVYRFFGTDGTLSFPDLTLTKYPSGAPKSWNSKMERSKLAIDQDARVPFERQLDHFVKVIKGLEKPSCSGQEGLGAVRICNAIREALQRQDGTVHL